MSRSSLDNESAHITKQTCTFNVLVLYRYRVLLFAQVRANESSNNRDGRAISFQ